MWRNLPGVDNVVADGLTQVLRLDLNTTPLKKCSQWIMPLNEYFTLRERNYRIRDRELLTRTGPTQTNPAGNQLWIMVMICS
jgi:hypothetical protein